MADQVVQITAGAGTKVDVTETLRADGQLVERQRMVVMDDSDVDSAGQAVAGEAGHGQAFVRDPELVQILGELTLLLSESMGADEDQLSQADTVEELDITDDGAASVDLRRGQLLEFAAVDTAASGDNVIVKMQPQNKIKVVSYVLVVTSAISVRWLSKPAAGNSKNMSGAMALAANGGVSSPAGSPGAWLMETELDQDLVLNLGAATQVSGHVAFFREP